MGVMIPVVVLILAMSLAFPGFSSPFNVEALLATIAVTALVGLSQLSVLAIGHFNLALPAMGAFTGMVVGWLLQDIDLYWPLALVIGLAFAALLGLVQGLLISRLKLNGFVVTLGLASAYTGLMFVVLGNQRFQQIGPALPEIGRGAVDGIPNIFIISMATCAIVWVVFARTVPGRHLLAVGASLLTARFSAIPVDRTILIAHTLSGVLAGVAAVLVVSRLAVGSPAIGQDWLLPSFAAPILGGTLLFGGKVSVIGTILGAVLLAVIANALVIVGVSQHWYQAGLGLIILGAVGVDQLRLRRVMTGHA
jgi:ribose transport system permease protein